MSYSSSLFSTVISCHFNKDQLQIGMYVMKAIQSEMHRSVYDRVDGIQLQSYRLLAFL